MAPRLYTPLFIELHSGSDLKNDVGLYYVHGGKFSLKLRGGQLLSYLYKFFIKHRWLKLNDYACVENHNSLLFLNHKNEDYQLSKKSFNDSNTKSKNSVDDVEEEKEEDIHEDHDELKYASLPIIQEIKVIFLNFGAICHNIDREKHEEGYTRFVHIFRFPF